MFDAILFDLDGTLVDSAPDIHNGVNEILAMDGVAPLPLETVRGFIGGGVPVLIERVIRACGLPTSRHADYCTLFTDLYENDPAGLTLPYPGVESALDVFFQTPLGLCTNKPFGATRSLLYHLAWTGQFSVIVAGDTLPVRKPDPAPLRLAVERIGGGNVLFVGDSEVDAETAQAAGVPFLLFTGGYRSTPVKDLPHAGSFDHWRDMRETVRRVSDAIHRGR